MHKVNFNRLSFLQLAVSREMNKRGFYTSSGKSADTRSSGNGDVEESIDNDNEDSQTLSPPQTNGQRKKITDLKIDLNFVPNKNTKLKKTSNDKAAGATGRNNPPSPGKTPQPKIRGMHITGKNINK